MGPPVVKVGAVVLITFPVSDLSRSKRRPAVVLASADRGDWVLCQITSNAYADGRAVKLEEEDFEAGSLQRTSHARPAKLFTVHESLFVATAGSLNAEAMGRVSDAIVGVIQPRV